MLKKVLKNKKGVTLVELTIVIALVAIITTMVGGFLTSFKGSSYMVLRSGNKVSEINTARDTVRNWLLAHDTLFYRFSETTETVQTNGETKSIYKVSATANEKYLKALKGIQDNFEEDYPNGAIWFANGQLHWDGDSALTFETISDIKFYLKSGYPDNKRKTYVTKTNGEIERDSDGKLKTTDIDVWNVLCCDITMKDGSSQTLIFTIFSQTYRDRYSAGLVIEE